MSPASATPNNVPAEFLASLFSDLPEGARILVWSAKGDAKRSYFAASIDDAARWALDEDAHGANVYVGVGWQSRDLGAHARGKATDVAGLAGFWADVDVAKPGSAKRYPADFDAARALLAALPLAPTIVVNTGGGLHAWWCFREGWEFDTDEERERAAALVRGWGYTIQGAARAAGVEVDSVWDLARVLRVPGTHRRKAGEPTLPVTIEAYDANRAYNPGDFEEYAAASVDSATPAPEIGALRLDPSAEPPFLKFQALVVNDPDFDRTFRRQRPDLKDQSPSAYDLSLASRAVAVDWTDQEIVNLLIAFRRVHGEAPKLRQDYYRRTLQRARQVGAREQAATSQAAEREQRETLVREISAVVDDGGERPALLEYLAQALGTPVAGVIQHGQQQSRWSIRLTDFREVAIGATEALLNVATIRARIAEATGHVVPHYKPAEWLRVARALLAVAELHDNPELTRRSQIFDWVSGYVSSQAVRWRDEKWYGALEQNDPFIRDGHVFIYAGQLHRYVKLTEMALVEPAELRDMLRAAGFQRCHETGPRRDNGAGGKGSRLCRSYWSLPLETLERDGTGIAE